MTLHKLQIIPTKSMTDQKKLTKAQRTALWGLVYDLDELDNKPRRLFASLRDVAKAFLSEKHPAHKEHKEEIISSIDQFEELYYKRRFELPMLVERIASISIELSRELKKEFPKYYEEEERDAYMQGARDARRMMAKQIINEAFDGI